MLFLPFHSPVLEPDFDLAFGKTERMSDLDATPSCEVAVEMEFLFKLECLVPRVRCA